MESLQCLKQALDAGLITAADYDTGKTAFLRAQQVRTVPPGPPIQATRSQRAQIRSGFESGLLSKADYESARALGAMESAARSDALSARSRPAF